MALLIELDYFLPNVCRSIVALIISFYHSFKCFLIIDIGNVDFLHNERRWFCLSIAVFSLLQPRKRLLICYPLFPPTESQQIRLAIHISKVG